MKKVTVAMKLVLLGILFIVGGCISEDSETGVDVKEDLKRGTIKRTSGSEYEVVYFRGTANNWNKLEMDLNGESTWKTIAEFGNGTDERFKIDVSEDWIESYPAEDYQITDGAGKYEITFDETTKSVSASKIEEGFSSNYETMYYRGSQNNWEKTAMNLVADNTWELEINGLNSFKFDVYGDWSLNFGDDNSDGIADQSGDNIDFNDYGTYVLSFNDATKEYSFKETNVELAEVSVDISFTDEVIGNIENLVGKQVMVYEKNNENYSLIDGAEILNGNQGLSSSFNVQPGIYKIKIYESYVDGKWKYEGESQDFSVLSGEDLSLSLELTETIMQDNIIIRPDLEGFSSSMGNSSPLIGLEVDVYKNGNFIGNQDINSFYIYHGIDGAEISFKEKEIGSYKIVLDKTVNGIRYFGETTFEITEEWESVNPDMSCYQEEVSVEKGTVKIKVLADYINEGELISVPVNNMGVFLGDWHAGDRLGTTNENGTIEVELDEGDYEFSIFKMTSSHSTVTKYNISGTSSPSEITEIEVHVAMAQVRIKAENLNLNSNEALYITGETEHLGNWTEATKMSYNSNTNTWSIYGNFPENANYKVVKAENSESRKISTENVQWELGGNNTINEINNYYESVNTIYPSFY
ncbi:MAG: carbohydrate-binding module family 20 domain-containing protein [Fusobacteriota bacterium]